MVYHTYVHIPTAATHSYVSTQISFICIILFWWWLYTGTAQSEVVSRLDRPDRENKTFISPNTTFNCTLGSGDTSISLPLVWSFELDTAAAFVCVSSRSLMLWITGDSSLLLAPFTTYGEATVDIHSQRQPLSLPLCCTNWSIGIEIIAILINKMKIKHFIYNFKFTSNEIIMKTSVWYIIIIGIGNIQLFHNYILFQLKFFSLN